MIQSSSSTRYDVIELRRTTAAPGGRQQFARYIETLFPEAFQQLGALAFGHFFERGRVDRFTWLRGYRDMPARAAVNHAFYDGPVWAEHQGAIGRYSVGHDDVLLLRPLYPDSGITALPAVDPVAEPMGAQGIGVIQVFRAAAGRLGACALAAEDCFANYRGRGVTEAAILITLDAPNNFPRHPVRGDGSYLVWIGMLRDEAALASLQPAFDAAARSLAAAGLLDGAPELLVLDPGPRSRLRWMPVVPQRAQAAGMAVAA